MRRSAIVTVLASAASVAVIAGCGSSSTKSSSTAFPLPSTAAPTPQASTVAPTQAPSSSGSSEEATLTGQQICDAVPGAQVRVVLPSGAGPATPSEPQAGVHACAWKATDGKSALVVLLVDNPDTQPLEGKKRDVTNAAAGTDFSGLSYSTKDVGVREITAYALTDDNVDTDYPGVDDVAGSVRDAVSKVAFG